MSQMFKSQSLFLVAPEFGKAKRANSSFILLFVL